MNKKTKQLASWIKGGSRLFGFLPESRGKLAHGTLAPLITTKTKSEKE
jgi:hypothetical protein